MAKYVKLDDSIVFYYLMRSLKEEDEILKDLAYRILNRKMWVMNFKTKERQEGRRKGGRKEGREGEKERGRKEGSTEWNQSGIYELFFALCNKDKLFKYYKKKRIR